MLLSITEVFKSTIVHVYVSTLTQWKYISSILSSLSQIVNIKDAYMDSRFNPEVDQKTGFKTRNILCMPIHGNDDVIGVMEVMNRCVRRG